MKPYSIKSALRHETILHRNKFTRLASSVSLILAAAGVLAVTTPARAITCAGEWQVLENGARISTPYCRDENLANFAQRAGIPVSGDKVRADYGTKKSLCSAFALANLDIASACVGDGPPNILGQ